MVELDRDWDELPIAELQQLDALCDTFEQALARDPDSRIESFVVGLNERHQRLVVPELVQLEIERREVAGQSVEPDAYAERFPQVAEKLRALANRDGSDARAASAGADTVIRNALDDTQTSASRSQPSSQMAGDALSWLNLPDDGIVGHFQLQSIIGRGGMGVVVRAHDTDLARDVAIKILAPEFHADTTAHQRFLREARAAALIQHHHVVTVYGVEQINGIPALVMELVEGTTLDEFLRANKRLPAEEVVALSQQIADGLAAAHKHGLVHRDVKPANILLESRELPDEKRWHVKITDFGLARVAAETPLTSAGLIAGTPQYMSPEQADGREVDTRSDLFSLGSVMYRMCAGRPPFESDLPVGVLRQVADKVADSLRNVSPETPSWLIDIIDKLMAKSPDERFQSAAEVATALGNGGDDSALAATQTRLLKQPALVGALAVVAVPLAVFALAMLVPHDGVGPTTNGDNAVQEADTKHGIGPVDGPPRAVAPFDSEQANSHQRAWADYLGVSVETTNAVGMTMMLIPPGEFSMGTSNGQIEELVANSAQVYHPLWNSEGPRHRVTITQPFRMSAYEVTRGQFRAFVEDANYETDAEKDGQGGFGLRDGAMHQAPEFIWSANPGFEQTDDHPVLNVSWNDAVAFCEWLTTKEGITYRLPTEAQWEYACRAGSTTPWHSGDNPATLGDYGWLDEHYAGRTRPVGRLKANSWRLYDLHGNAWEWCADRSGLTYYGQSPANDPPGPEVGPDRIYRGGSWFFAPAFCRSAVRYFGAETHRNASIGFRVVAHLPSQPSPAD